MPTYKNTYKPVNQPEVGDVMSITPEDYDFNFVFPVQALRTDRIELRPFVVSWMLISSSTCADRLSPRYMLRYYMIYS